MSFATLKTDIENVLARTDLNGFLSRFIRDAENELYRKVRLRGMEKSFSSDIASGTIALPTSYLSLKYAYINQAPVQWLDRKSPEWIYRHYPTRSSDGLPVAIAREAETFIFGPFPDSNYTVKGVYYKRPVYISVDDSDSWFLDNYQHVLFYGALVQASRFIANDPRASMWQQEYERSIEALVMEDDHEEYSGSALATVPA